MAIPCRVSWSLGVHSFPVDSSFPSESGPAVQVPGKSRVRCMPRGFWHDGDGKAVLDRPCQRDTASKGGKRGSRSGRSGGNIQQTVEHGNSNQPEPGSLNGIRNPKQLTDDQTPKPAANARERREARRARERELLQAILALHSPGSRGRRENSRGRNGRGRNPADCVEEAVTMVMQALGPKGNDEGVKANVKHVTAAVKVGQRSLSMCSDAPIASRRKSTRRTSTNAKASPYIPCIVHTTSERSDGLVLHLMHLPTHNHPHPYQPHLPEF